MKPINMKNAMRAYTDYQTAVNWCYNNTSEHAKAVKVKAEEVYKSFTGKDSAIYKALSEVQKKSRVRRIAVTEIIDALQEVEDLLRIPKKAMAGIRVCIDLNAQSFPNAYKGIPESTIFCAVYKSGSWLICNIERSKTHSANRRVIITHTEASKAALIERFSHLS